MTFNEFKAWLDGYTDAMGTNAPTPEQWVRIREKIASVVSDDDDDTDSPWTTTTIRAAST